MDRRGFLKAMGYAAPTIFVPKLITVNWGVIKPQQIIWNLPYRAGKRHLRYVDERIFHYAPKYSPLLMLKGGIMPGPRMAPPAIAPPAIW